MTPSREVVAFESFLRISFFLYSKNVIEIRTIFISPVDDFDNFVVISVYILTIH